MMKCSRCGRDISGDEIYSHKGQTLCEDCYIDAISPEKSCDPWATYLSTRTRERAGLKGAEGLTETERKIYDFVRSKGKATREEVMSGLSLSAQELGPQVNVLLHAELIKERSEGSTMYLIPVPVKQ